MKGNLYAKLASLVGVALSSAFLIVFCLLEATRVSDYRFATASTRTNSVLEDVHVEENRRNLQGNLSTLCAPRLATNVDQCLSKIAACSPERIYLKWTGPGCRGPQGQIYSDGGCQCKGYCNYGCRGPCTRDNECYWNNAEAACYSRATGARGVPMPACPRQGECAPVPRDQLPGGPSDYCAANYNCPERFFNISVDPYVFCARRRQNSLQGTCTVAMDCSLASRLCRTDADCEEGFNCTDDNCLSDDASFGSCFPSCFGVKRANATRR